MIIIDGHHSGLRIGNFSNLEEILISATQDTSLENRVVTDVLLNDRIFSELYPHQAEDIDAKNIHSIEISSMPVGEMALNITSELFKVVNIMNAGSRNIARLFRQADDNDALEILQDLLSVTRDFLGMVGVLRTEFLPKDELDLSNHIETISALLGEMSEVMENEDWVLLADLIEYEFVPVCESWKQIIQRIQDSLSETVAG